jgi:ubiquinol-cytochrome c reductase cytochrome b subunit
VKTISNWLDDRTGYRRLMRGALDEPIPGGASFAYVFGSALVFALLLQFITGVLLAMYYSPSTSAAWASVAYIQDQVALGWFVRGLHHHGASALIILAGLHMLQTAVYGAYKKPRELNWIVGVLMMALIMAFALTGYLLPWDQTGYWATKVATGIAGTTPVVGREVQHFLQGGNEYGNLTLTRFYAIHVFILPALMITLVAVHLYLFRRHGVTPSWKSSPEQLERKTERFWPAQMFRDVVAMAVVFAVLVGVNVYTLGAPLDAPADPSSSFDARPEWYLRAPFQILQYFSGTMEDIAALGTPVIVGGILIALPFLDRGPSRDPLKRLPYLGALGLVLGAAGALTAISLWQDAQDEGLKLRIAEAEEQAAEARRLAREHGVPPEGGVAVFTMAEHYRARQLWASHCASCHDGEDRSAPEISAGYNSRAWIADFMRDPGGDRFFGRTGHDGMSPVTLEGEAFDAVVELVYAQTGAEDADAELAERGLEVFNDTDCWHCHSIDGEEEGDMAPNLGGRGTVEMLTDFIGLPGHELWFGPDAEMPPFEESMAREDRRLLAEWIVSLQSAEPGWDAD